MQHPKRPTTHSDEITQYWNSRSTTYCNNIIGELSDERRDGWERILYAHAEPALEAARAQGRTPRVIDLGCGPGFFEVIFALRGCAVDGIDTSERMLERAYANVSAALRESQAALGRTDVLTTQHEGQTALDNASASSQQHKSQAALGRTGASSMRHETQAEARPVRDGIRFSPMRPEGRATSACASFLSTQSGGQVTLHCADVASLPLDDNVFDLAISRNVTWLMREPQAAYE